MTGATAFYNEIDPFAAEWLRNLIKAGEIPIGEVDERPIEQLKPADLMGYAQCHFFAGIGGWPLALRFAGWADSRPVWTGSCPCQPFSVAGKGKGVDDPRHLWPVFRRLIAECFPDVIFGEQVAGAAGLGWLAGVQADVEEDSYRLGFAELCAAGVGSPHIRQRLFWVADSENPNWRSRERGAETAIRENSERWRGSSSGGAISGVPDSNGARLEKRGELGEYFSQKNSSTIPPRSNGYSDYDILPCLDGKARRTEPGLHPLAHGVSGRMVVRRADKENTYSRTGALKGFGNAIVPQVAAGFVRAYMDVVDDD